MNQFIDMHDIGDALLHDGFAEPVMEAEVLTVTYDTVDEVMRDLKAIGANVTSVRTGGDDAEASNPRGLTGKDALRKVRDHYEQFRTAGVLPASYEVIYGHAWKAENRSLSEGAETAAADRSSRFVEFQR